MQQIRKHSSVSNLLRVRLRNSGTGQGLTGLTFASTGLIISTITDAETTPTAYTVAAGKIEDITTIGTYAAPTATKCRFKEVDATNDPGLYEIQLADARYAVANAKTFRVFISGAANLIGKESLIQLTQVDLDDSVRAGLSALPNAAANAANGLYVIGGTGVSLAATAIQAIWDALTSALTTVGSIGKRLADNVDAATSSRMATFVYTAPDNATIAAIQTAFTTFRVTYTDLRGAKLDNLDAAVSSRMATFVYIAPDNVGIGVAAGAALSVDDKLTTARAGYLDKLNVAGVLANTSNANLFMADVSGLLTSAVFLAYDVPTKAELDAAQAAIIAAMPAFAGNGDVLVDHDYTGDDVWQILDANDVPVDNAILTAYPAADYNANVIDPEAPTSVTGSDGRWIRPMRLDPDDYKLTVYNPATKITDVYDLEVT